VGGGGKNEKIYEEKKTGTCWVEASACVLKHRFLAEKTRGEWGGIEQWNLELKD